MQSPFANQLANHYMGNPYALHLHMLASQFPHNQDFHSLSPFGAGIPHQPHNHQRMVQDVTPDPGDTLLQYEYRVAPEEIGEDPTHGLNYQRTVQDVTPDTGDAPHQHEYLAGTEETGEDPTHDLYTAAPLENPVNGQGEDFENHEQNQDRGDGSDEPVEIPPEEDEQDRANTYTESEYMQSEHMQPEHMQSEYIQSEHTQSEYIQSEHMQSEDMQPVVNVCSVCGEQFPSKRKLSKHRGLTGHHEPFTEEEQGSVEQPDSGYYEDASESTKQAINPLQCARCNETFPSRNQLFKHIKALWHFVDDANHGSRLEETNRPTMNPRQCARCNEIFPSRNQLFKHMEAYWHYVDEAEYSASLYHAEAERTADNVSQLEETHRQMTDPRQCAMCNEIFPSRNQLFKHIEAFGHFVDNE
ncbi:hypothetical protein B0I35DRAFT_267993 [Stachybotrys elegans]|uniref:C2H2-type domain-containing protein n=1 Tax=Stachybotrys elegans TaxID=80388 RepID=A0A8K0SVM1_9HYPO|nr:hypothetical protein B0I35DRAFT_267993 [Stachybotrys elegans]